jgi:ADP-heptose:LPS heptosyltransferase
MPSLVVWAGQQEQQWARQIVEHSGGHALLAPPTNLLQLAAVVRRALFFLGGDTGPLHLASAVNTPCVALFGPTRACDSGPYGRRHQIVQSPVRVSRRQRRTNMDPMWAIEVDAVTSACDQLIRSLTADDQVIVAA